MLVVLSSEVDPLGVRASAFSLALADGRRVTPERASVWPAHERGEHRSVLLEADLGGPGSSPPVNLTVVEHVFTADGRDLRGATAPVRPFEEPDSLIAWARVKPGETDCPNGEPAVRTFWSDLVRADENIVEVVRLLRADGSEVAATAVGDREDAEKADNVLDFCTTDPGGVVGLRISDAVTDLAGHPVQSAIAAVDRT